MATYRVLYKPEPAMTGALERTQCVRDGFSVLAVAFPVLWLVWYRQWFAALMAFLALVGVQLVASSSLVFIALALNLLIGLAVALEGPQWRVASLRRSGWREVASIEAQSREEAELRFFLDGDMPVATEVPKPLAPVAPGPASDMFFPVGER